MNALPSAPFSSWPPARKWAAGLFGALCLVGLCCAAIYLAAVIFLVLHKADPRQARFTSIVAYWGLYAADDRLRRQLIGSIAASAVGCLVVLPGTLIAASQRRRPLHGDARFATPAEVAQVGLLDDGKDPSPGILIGRYRGRFLALRGQLSAMLSAPTRSGKGVGVVIPNLLNWPDSVVVLDIKGENFDVTAGFRAACGQAVFAFSPFDAQARSHRWNPLSAIRADAIHRVGDLLTIGQVLFPNDVGSTSSEAFFNDQARNLFLGLGLLLLETPALPRTIGEMLRQSSGKGRSLKEHLGQTIRERAQAAPLTDECVDALQRLLSNSENTLSSIVATFNAPLIVFADAVVDAATSANDFALQDLRRRRMSIYVRIPPNRLATARPLLNLFFSQLVHLNTDVRPEQDPELCVQCLLVNDEFTSMGRVGIIASAAAFLAGYDLRLLTVVQAMSQLDAVYGEKEARTFATNHGLQILYAPREQRDADEYSAMLGHFTERGVSRGRSRSFGQQHSHRGVSENESDQRRALLLPQEFKELGAERIVVIRENCKPILADKIRYHCDAVFRKRLRLPPEVPAMNMNLHLARTQQRWRYAPEDLAPGETLEVSRLADDYSDLDMPTEGCSADEVQRCLTGFFDRTLAPAPPSTGGAIEPAEEDQARGEGAQVSVADRAVGEERDPASELDLSALDAPVDSQLEGAPS